MLPNGFGIQRIYMTFFGFKTLVACGMRSGIFGTSVSTKYKLLQDKLVKHGVQSLSNCELLALFLDGTNASWKVEQKMELLMQSFGGLRGLFSAKANQLNKSASLKEWDATRIQILPELSRRHILEEVQRGPTLSTAPMVRRYVRQRMRDYNREVFMCIFLNARHQVIGVQELFVGSINGAHVYPREVVHKCLECNAVSVILVHNHPSGQPEPSDSDARITRRLNSVLAIMDIRLVDHLVVGESEVVSLNQRGLI